MCGYVWGKTCERIEVPITNERDKQTYFGALDYRSKKFFVQSYPTANSQNTVAFLKYLQSIYPGRRLGIIWDGASYHKSQELTVYLTTVNQGLQAALWRVTCILFAPNAPEQNPVEDIWLQAKNFVRRFYHLGKSFSAIKTLFEIFTHHQVFNFPKLHEYAVFS